MLFGSSFFLLCSMVAHTNETKTNKFGQQTVIVWLWSFMWKKDDLEEPIVTTTSTTTLATHTHARKYAISNAWKCTIIPFLVYFFLWLIFRFDNQFRLFVVLCIFSSFIQCFFQLLLLRHTIFIMSYYILSFCLFMHTTYRKLKPIHELCSSPH